MFNLTNKVRSCERSEPRSNLIRYTQTQNFQQNQIRKIFDMLFFLSKLFDFFVRRCPLFGRSTFAHRSNLVLENVKLL